MNVLIIRYLEVPIKKEAISEIRSPTLLVKVVWDFCPELLPEIWSGYFQKLPDRSQSYRPEQKNDLKW